MSRPLQRSNSPGEHASADAGRASLEFLIAGIVLFIPVLLLTVSLWSIQRASLATEAAARHAARVLTQATDADEGLRGAERAVASAMGSFGVDADYRIDIDCRPAGQCVDPGSLVRVRVSTDVAVGAIPPIPAALPISVPISGVADARVSEYRGRP